MADIISLPKDAAGPFPRSLRTWTFSLNISLVGADRLPPGEISFERPQLVSVFSRASWLVSFNRNLVGADALPTGDIFVERPPLLKLVNYENRSWAFVPLLLTTLVPPPPPPPPPPAPPVVYLMQ